MKNDHHRKIFSSAVVALIALMALGVRWLPYVACFQPDRLLFSGPDCYYHLRRLFILLYGEGASPPIDYFLGFPVGTADILPPLFYFLMALPAWVVGFGSPTQETAELVAAVTPTVAGVVCVITVFFLGCELYGRTAGFVAAAVLAVLPAHVTQTAVGMADNNAIEPMLAAIYLLLLVRALPKPTDEAGSGAGSLGWGYKWIVPCGISGWFALFSWRGSIMFFVTVFVGGLVSVTVEAWREREPPEEVCRAIGGSSLILAIATLPFVIAGHWGAQLALKFNVISWFHVLILAAGAGFFLCWPWLQRLQKGQWSGRVVAGRLLGVVILLAVTVLLALERCAPQDLSLQAYLWGGGGLWDVAELQSLFLVNGRVDATAAFELFGWLLTGIPVIWIALSWAEARKGFPCPRRTLFLVWSLVFLVAAVARLRFAALAAVPFSICVGAMFSSELIAPGNIRCRVRTAFFALCIVFLLFPAFKRVFELRFESYKFPITDDLFQALEWVGKETPPTGSFLHPSERPDYGIMAQWDFGHWINFISKRPAVATPMGTETHGMEAQSAFFLADRNEEVVRVLSENRARYVIVSQLLPYLPKFARLLGVPEEGYVQELAGPDGRTSFAPGQRWSQLVSTRLLLNDGWPLFAGEGGAPPSPRLRLIYESRGTARVRIPGLSRTFPTLKVYELVNGAVLSGRAPARSVVSAEIRMVTRFDRIFLWRGEVQADDSGAFDIVVPYATLREPMEVRAVGPYTVKTPSGEVFVEVTEDDVLRGTRVLVHLTWDGTYGG